MKAKQFKIFLVFVFTISIYNANAQDSLTFKGQFSAYTHLNSENKLPWWSGSRYIPQLNYEYRWANQKQLDFETAANLYSNVGFKINDSVSLTGKIRPYRLWARYATNQFELRAGLQKINFGSASILRPLMWFDQLDPRDPLKLTDGVWGALARYYFLNNANIWLWGLYGNKNYKGWETFNSNEYIPEFGGRFQFPVPKGEAGLSYHHRTADGSILSDSTTTIGNITENRFGFDAKFDMEIGWWVEASWSNYNEEIGLYSNQELANIGIDYTFGIGNGLTIVYEQLVTSFDESPFQFQKTTTFSLLSLSYPIGIFNNLSAMVYYDWTNNKAYNFLTWQNQFNKFSLYLMGYLNPKEYRIPAGQTNEGLYAGYGLQVMLVFNH